MPQLDSNNSFKSIFTNVSILSLARIVKLGAGIGITSLLAQYLGKDQFGLFSYSFAIMSLLGVFGGLGLEAVLRKEYNQVGACYSRLLGTAALAQLTAGLTLFVFFNAFAASLWQQETRQTLQIASICLLGGWNVAFTGFFQNQLKNGIVAIVQLLAFVLVSIAKVSFIYYGKSLQWFALAESMDSILNGFFLLFIYLRGRNRSAPLKFKYPVFRDLMKESWPVVLTSISVVLFLRIDQIMIAQIKGQGDVGTYSAAIKLSESWGFIPSFLSVSILPYLMSAKKKSAQSYNRAFSIYLETSFLIGYAIVLSIYASAPWMINAIYGAEYSDSISILRIHIVGIVFVFLNVVRGQRFLIDGMLKHSLVISILATFLNILMNLLWIPRHGPQGAAYATVISQLFIAAIAPFGFSKSRSFATLLWKSALPIKIILFLKNKSDSPDN